MKKVSEMNLNHFQNLFHQMIDVILQVLTTPQSDLRSLDSLTTGSIKFLLARLMAEDYERLVDLTLGALCSHKEVFRLTQFF